LILTAQNIKKCSIYFYTSAAAAENYLGLGGGGLKILKFFQSSAVAAGFFS
jgi:hypothetical protein